jgi:nitrate reductase molybdenum cofactor assembly chaperone NarJ/NarW
VRRGRPRDADSRVVHLVAAWCLDYPTPALVERLPQLAAALAEQPSTPAVTALTGLVDHLASTPLEELQRAYVDVFDLSRMQTLYLSYWTDGDTRRRGEVLAGFKAAYRAGGFLVDTRGELTDYLPMVLEFAARVDPEAGQGLLRTYRPSLELMRIGLQEKGSPYAAALVAVCAGLPGESPLDRAAVQAMVNAAGPSVELVGRL